MGTFSHYNFKISLFLLFTFLYSQWAHFHIIIFKKQPLLLILKQLAFVGKAMHVWGQGMYGKSQFDCEPKTPLKIKVY